MHRLLLLCVISASVVFVPPEEMSSNTIKVVIIW